MLIVFDLDFTLWNCGGTWCDHTSPPYTTQNGILMDTEGRKISLYPDSYSILEKLRNQERLIAVASRTYAPQWADELMQLFDIKKFMGLLNTKICPNTKISIIW